MTSRSSATVKDRLPSTIHSLDPLTFWVNAWFILGFSMLSMLYGGPPFRVPTS